MQSCEILQALSQTNEEKRKEFLGQANLRQVKKVTLSHDKIKVNLFILVPIKKVDVIPGRLAKGEIVIGLVDDCRIENVLRMCTKPTEILTLKSVGLLQEVGTAY